MVTNHNMTLGASENGDSNTDYGHLIFTMALTRKNGERCGVYVQKNVKVKGFKPPAQLLYHNTMGFSSPIAGFIKQAP